MADEPIPPDAYPPVNPEDPGWIENPGETANPDGTTITNTPYKPATQEEKAERLEVDMAQDVNIAPDAPYPLGDPIDEEQALEVLMRCQPPMNLVPSDEYQSAAEKNLAAGGSVEQEELKRLRNAL